MFHLFHTHVAAMLQSNTRLNSCGLSLVDIGSFFSVLFEEQENVSEQEVVEEPWMMVAEASGYLNQLQMCWLQREEKFLVCR